MASAILLQSYMRPKPEAPVAGAVAQAGQETGQEDLGADAEAALAPTATEGQTSGDATSAEAAPAVQAEADTDQAAAPAVQRTSTDDFVQMGSLSDDGSDRYLVTINKRAGTIHRV